MDWIELLLPLACAFVVGVLANRWWAVALVVFLGVVAVVYVATFADRVSILLATRVLTGWALAAAAGVFARRGIERALDVRRTRGA